MKSSETNLIVGLLAFIISNSAPTLPKALLIAIGCFLCVRAIYLTWKEKPKEENHPEIIRKTTPNHPTLTETPRTDAEDKTFQGATRGVHVVPTDFARQLERELLEAQKALASIEEYGTDEINEAVDLRHKLVKTEASLRRTIEIAEELNNVVPYLVSGPFKMVEKVEQHAKLRAELDTIKATLPETK